MIGVHFHKSPRTTTVISLLDAGDLLTHAWTASLPYTVFLSWGEAMVNGVVLNAPGFLEVPAGLRTSISATKDGTFIMFMFLTEEILPDLPGVDLMSRSYAGTWRDQLQKDWPTGIVTLIDLERLATAALESDRVFVEKVL